MKYHSLLGVLVILAFILLSETALYAQKTSTLSDSTKSKGAPRFLFTNDSTLQFTLTANMRTLLKDRGEKPINHAAVLTYTDAEKQTVRLPLQMKVRGNFRRNRANCLFPPLLIDLPKKKAKNSLFAKQNKLKLVTHCQVDEWVVREYLVYRMYNLLTDLSFRAQLAQVTYADSLGKRDPETHWGFLLEDEDDVAKRNKVKVNNIKQTNMGYADSLQMATVAVFEYMIGNTDWSVPYLHNIRLFANDETGSLPVPYDFDHAGIVDTRYALPAEQLGIKTVRERMYRGLIYSKPIFQKVFDKFNATKPQFYALYQNDSRLNKGYVKNTLRYLDEFYALINNPALVQEVFGKGAKSGVVVKGLK
ncbi:hypothetical protein GCM10028805_14620 [Spirosoma harenae]